MRSAHWALVCLAVVMLVVTRVSAIPTSRSGAPSFIGSLQSAPLNLGGSLVS
jgi:hypothetical protein